MNISKVLIASFLLISIHSFAQNDTIVKPKVLKKENSISISIIQLIANPEKYNGKRVSIEGYLITEFEGTAIYLSRDDYEHGVRKNAIWVDMKADHAHIFNKEYVGVDGVFDMKSNGHFSAYSGTLKNIGFNYRKN